MSLVQVRKNIFTSYVNLSVLFYGVYKKKNNNNNLIGVFKNFDDPNQFRLGRIQINKNSMEDHFASTRFV